MVQPWANVCIIEEDEGGGFNGWEKKKVQGVMF